MRKRKANFPAIQKVIRRTVISTVLAGCFGVAQSEEATVLSAVKVTEQAVQGYAVKRASTATRTDTPIIDTPFSIQVISQEVMKDQGAYRLEDIVQNVSAVQALSANRSYETLISRGFKAEPFRDGSKVYFLTVPLANAERVEVLKGAAAVQYGRIEPGGMINVVTKEPLAVPRYEIQQDVGTDGLFRTSADLTGPLNESKTLLYRLNGEYLDQDSFVDHAFKKRTFIAPSLAYRSGGTDISLAYEYRDEKSTGIPGIPAIGNRPAAVPRGSFYGEPSLNDHYTINALNLKAEQVLNDNWKVRGGYSVWRGDYKYAGVLYAALDADGRTLHRNSGYDALQSHYDKRNTDNTYLDLEGKVNFLGVQHTLLFGADYRTFKNRANWYDGMLPDTDLYNPTYGQFDRSAFMAGEPTSFWVSENKAKGVYVQDQVKLNDQWQLLLGGRYDWTTTKNGYTGTSLGDADAIANDNALDENKFSPRVGLVFKPLPNISLYSSYTESFGSINSGRSFSNQQFSSESAKQYEVGAKGEFLNGQLVASTAVFELTKENVLTADPAHPGFSLPVGEVRSKGIEFDVSGQLTNRLSVITALAFIDAEVTKDNNTPGNQGNQLENAPKRAGRVWLKYDLPDGWSVGGGTNFVSLRQGDAANTYQLPGYATVDAYAAYRFKVGATKMTAQLNLTNIFDKSYFVSSDWSGSYYGAPRGAVASLKASF